jgi:hypothetical protein
MSKDDYRLKREKNNQSVKRCRMNEKNKIEKATIKLEEYKKESQMLEEKYACLQKELNTLKSLFFDSANSSSSDDSMKDKDKAYAKKDTNQDKNESFDPFELELIASNFLLPINSSILK